MGNKGPLSVTLLGDRHSVVRQVIRDMVTQGHGVDLCLQHRIYVPPQPKEWLWESPTHWNCGISLFKINCGTVLIRMSFHGKRTN